MAEKTRIDLKTGIPVKKVFLLSGPLIVSNLMHVLYNIVDTMWLGMLGKEEVAAMAFVFPIVFLVVSLGIGIGIAGSVFVAQYEGAGEKEKVNFSAAQTFVFTLAMSVVISIIGYFSSFSLVNLMGASPEVLPLAVSYLKVIFLGIVLIFSFFIFNALMRGWGNTKTPMKIMIGSNIINMALDPLLIFGVGFFPEMGITGAALATVISRFIASVIGIYLLFSRRYDLSIHLKDLKPDFKMIKKIFSVGWPATAEHALRALGMMVLTAIVAVLGTVYVAAYGIGVRVFSIFIMPSVAVSMGVTSVVGQNLGAGLNDRAKKAAIDTAIVLFIIMSILGLGVFLAKTPVAKLFLQADGAEVINVAVSFLKRLVIAGPFLGAAIVLRGAFKGAGRTLQSMVIGLIGLLGVRVSIAYIAVEYINSASFLWNAFIISSVVELIICFGYYSKGRWAQRIIKKEVLEQPPAEIPGAEEF